MKNSLLIGAMLGVVAATAIYRAVEEKPAKKVKKTLAEKLESLILD